MVASTKRGGKYQEIRPYQESRQVSRDAADLTKRDRNTQISCMDKCIMRGPVFISSIHKHPKKQNNFPDIHYTLVGIFSPLKLIYIKPFPRYTVHVNKKMQE
jgi:hypothetical protein